MTKESALLGLLADLYTDRAALRTQLAEMQAKIALLEQRQEPAQDGSAT